MPPSLPRRRWEHVLFALRQGRALHEGGRSEVYTCVSTQTRRDRTRVMQGLTLTSVPLMRGKAQETWGCDHLYSYMRNPKAGRWDRCRGQCEPRWAKRGICSLVVYSYSYCLGRAGDNTGFTSFVLLLGKRTKCIETASDNTTSLAGYRTAVGLNIDSGGIHATTLQPDQAVRGSCCLFADYLASC